MVVADHVVGLRLAKVEPSQSQHWQPTTIILSGAGPVATSSFCTDPIMQRLAATRASKEARVVTSRSADVPNDRNNEGGDHAAAFPTLSLATAFSRCYFLSCNHWHWHPATESSGTSHAPGNASASGQSGGELDPMFLRQSQRAPRSSHAAADWVGYEVLHGRGYRYCRHVTGTSLPQ